FITPKSAADILSSMSPSESVAEEPHAPLDALLESHRAFLRDLERRVGDRGLAEDILQDAFIKVMERPDQAPVHQGLGPCQQRARTVHDEPIAARWPPMTRGNRQEC